LDDKQDETLADCPHAGELREKLLEGWDRDKVDLDERSDEGNERSKDERRVTLEHGAAQLLIEPCDELGDNGR